RSDHLGEAECSRHRGASRSRYLSSHRADCSVLPLSTRPCLQCFRQAALELPDDSIALRPSFRCAHLRRGMESCLVLLGSSNHPSCAGNCLTEVVRTKPLVEVARCSCSRGSYRHHRESCHLPSATGPRRTRSEHSLDPPDSWVG